MDNNLLIRTQGIVYIVPIHGSLSAFSVLDEAVVVARKYGTEVYHLMILGSKPIMKPFQGKELEMPNK